MAEEIAERLRAVGDVLDAAEALASEAAAVLGGSLLRMPLEHALRRYTKARDRLDRYELDAESEREEEARG